MSAIQTLASHCPIGWYQPPPRSQGFVDGLVLASAIVGLTVLLRVCIASSRTSETASSPLRLTGARSVMYDILLVTVAWAGVLVLHRAWAAHGDYLTVFLGATPLGAALAARPRTIIVASLTVGSFLVVTCAGAGDLLAAHAPSPSGYYTRPPILVDAPMLVVLAAGPVLALAVALLFVLEHRRRRSVSASLAPMTGRRTPAQPPRQSDNRSS